MEKVKLKGLQEYVEQMKDCLKQQKEVEAQIYLAEILQADKTIQQFTKELEELQESVE